MDVYAFDKTAYFIMVLRRIIKKWKRFLRFLVLGHALVAIFLLVWGTTDRWDVLLNYKKVVELSDGMSVSERHVLRKSDDNGVGIAEYKTNFLKLNDTDMDKIRNIWATTTSHCHGNVTVHLGQFAIFKPLVVDFRKKQGRVGGENISEVINQMESHEYLNLHQGFFVTACNETIKWMFSPKNHLETWSRMLQMGQTPLKYSSKIPGWTIAVMRYEYANLYHTMTDFFNAFLLMRYLHLNPDDMSILWVDSHPVGALDETWSTLFKKVIRAGKLNETVLFDNFVWNIMGYDSMINKHDLPAVPLLENFRHFFLSRHDVPTAHARNCKKLKVLFLWRRDYVAHPRNPSGLVSRKIKNEDELLSAVSDLLPGHEVLGVQIDQLSMREQLATISNTDILIGMHGAGLTHALFLPKTSGLVELYPQYWPMANKHFRAISQWRGLFYQNMQNKDPKMELENRYTVIKNQTLVNIVHEMHHKMCGDIHNQ